VDALDAFDKLFEHRVRLAIAALLARHAEMTFSRLKTRLELTDGSLAAQLKRLEEADYLTVRKAFVQRKPTTWYALTPTGRRALDRHLDSLRALITLGTP